VPCCCLPVPRRGPRPVEILRTATTPQIATTLHSYIYVSGKYRISCEIVTDIPHAFFFLRESFSTMPNSRNTNSRSPGPYLFKFFEHFLLRRAPVLRFQHSVPQVLEGLLRRKRLLLPRAISQCIKLRSSINYLLSSITLRHKISEMLRN
jgi:hypothetical protein